MALPPAILQALREKYAGDLALADSLAAAVCSRASAWVEWNQDPERRVAELLADPGADLAGELPGGRGLVGDEKHRVAVLRPGQGLDPGQPLVGHDRHTSVWVARSS